MDQAIRIKVYVGDKLVHDSWYEREDALKSDKLQLHEVTDLEFHPVIEGQLMPESGKIHSKPFCVDSRELDTEGPEPVVIIHGYWC